MKKIILIFFLIFFIYVFINASEKRNINDFIKDAENISIELAKVKKELSFQEIKYEERIKKIEGMKNKKNNFFILNLFDELLLKYHLGIANNIAYRISSLTKKQRELNNDYFTTVSFILTEYGEKIRNCLKNKCHDLKNLYNDRIKWLDIIKDYENYIGVDLVSDVFNKTYDRKARKDLVEYFEKKIIQVEQRIYLLEEEINIDILLKKSGFKIDENKDKKMNEKIKELKYLKYILEEKIKELKNHEKDGF